MLGVAVGILQQVLGDLAGAAADVQNALRAAQVELALAQQPVAQVDVQRQQAGRGQQRPLRAAVHVADLVAILLVADPMDQVVFDQLVNDLFCGRVRRASSSWAGGNNALRIICAPAEQPTSMLGVHRALPGGRLQSKLDDCRYTTPAQNASAPSSSSFHSSRRAPCQPD